MKKFVVTDYEIVSEKLKKNPVKLIMVSDLHNVVFGADNSRLLRSIEAAKPDMILIAGDLVLGKKGAATRIAYAFLEKAVTIAPVFYGMGNHEQRMKSCPEIYGREYLVFEKKVKRLGVTFLENAVQECEVNGEKIIISGLALPYAYYRRGRGKQLEQRELTRLVGKASKEKFQILLAHTPRYAEAYMEWGADVTFSGHYHGGMVRLPFLGGVISPDFRLFPPYCHGIFTRDKHHLIVGAGLGEHTIPFRLWNPRELISVTCLPAGGLDF